MTILLSARKPLSFDRRGIRYEGYLSLCVFLCSVAYVLTALLCE